MSTSLEGLDEPGRAVGITRNHLAALGQDLAAGTRRLWGAYWDYQARRATVLVLEALDDRALKDIGLSRSEIRSAVLDRDMARRLYDPHWQRPARL